MLFFYPNSIEIVSRRIYYDHSEGLLTRNVNEKIIFKNSSAKPLSEIILEIENFKTNLKIIGNDGNELIFLPNYKLRERADLPQSIDTSIKDPELKRNFLLIKLKRQIEGDEYYGLSLHYIEYTKEETDMIEPYERYFNPFELEHFMYNEAMYMDLIEFYDRETVTIFKHWGNGLSLSDGDPYILYAKISDTDSDDDIGELDKSKLSLDLRKNSFSFSITKNDRERFNINIMAIFYGIRPEKKELSLIKALTMFVLLLPLADLISFFLHNISYLFDALETESVFILTLAFAQTRTRLLSHEKYVKLGLILTGSFFMIVLILILANIKI